MTLNFDIRGNLKPYQIVNTNHALFKETFVDTFDHSSSRYALYKKYLKYTASLSELLSKPYYQWIDGSFISTKANPKDIDLVSIIDYSDYEKHSLEIESEFVGSKAREVYQVDAYLVSEYPIDHPKFAFTNSDKLYWRSLFSRTRVNRAKKQYEKGFIQLNF